MQLLVAALAPRLLRVAGAVADGTILWMGNARAVESHVAPRIGKAAADAGRTAPRIVAGLPVAVHDDVAEARAVAARQFAVYGQLPNYQRILDHGGVDGPADAAIVGDEAAVAAAAAGPGRRRRDRRVGGDLPRRRRRVRFPPPHPRPAAGARRRLSPPRPRAPAHIVWSGLTPLSRRHRTGDPNERNRDARDGCPDEPAPADDRRGGDDLHVEEWGAGEPVVLVHGSLATGAEEWDAQRPLAEDGFRLLVLDRRGYGRSPAAVGEDFLVDADDIVELMGDGAHSWGTPTAGWASCSPPPAGPRRRSR